MKPAIGALWAAIAVACCAGAIGVAQDPEEPEIREPGDRPAAVGWGDVKIKPQAVNVAGIRAERMSLRERRELGLTVGNVRRIVRDLHKAGEIDSQTDPATVSLMVTDRLMTENATTYSQLSPQFDWDSFLAFVEKIVELVMRIISLFSYSVPAGSGADGLAVGGPSIVPVAMAA